MEMRPLYGEKGVGVQNGQNGNSRPFIPSSSQKMMIPGRSRYVKKIRKSSHLENQQVFYRSVQSGAWSCVVCLKTGVCTPLVSECMFCQDHQTLLMIRCSYWSGTVITCRHFSNLIPGTVLLFIVGWEKRLLYTIAVGAFLTLHDAMNLVRNY